MSRLYFLTLNRGYKFEETRQRGSKSSTFRSYSIYHRYNRQRFNFLFFLFLVTIALGRSYNLLPWAAWHIV
jgi:hypothetical protein